MTFHRISKTNDILYKLKSIELCSNTVGQMMTLMLVDPPREGREDIATVEQYYREKQAIYEGMKQRANLLSTSFNQMVNLECTEI